MKAASLRDITPEPPPPVEPELEQVQKIRGAVEIQSTYAA
jgi:hypothetical protein